MSQNRKPVIGISCGDLNGIGMEIIMKTFANPEMLDLCTPVVFASSKVASYHRKGLEMESFNFHLVKDLKNLNDRKPNLFQTWDEDVLLDFGKLDEKVGAFALKSLERACKAYKDGDIDALVTAPIHKNSIQSDRFNFTGHTDYLESIFEGKALMMMVSEEMKMALATVHVPLSDVRSKLSKESLVKTIKALAESLNYDFLVSKAKIGVLALNPHAGDGGVIGNDDDALVRPAIAEANESGALAFGPYPADSFFGARNHSKFDVLLAMYHDQGLIPFKSMSFGQGVNYTAGLSIIRTSPDHGTGFDIAGKNQANESSFRQAVYLACDLVKNRAISKKIHENPLTIKKGKKEY